eukprot:GFUD01090581.1.p1 GENE.GFUD01090581.1~~GFUD01090581.1.p1  ORF type:complete len:130 (+),score=13.94 GFUD01090581.1:123-512(+)
MGAMRVFFFLLSFLILVAFGEGQCKSRRCNEPGVKECYVMGHQPRRWTTNGIKCNDDHDAHHDHHDHDAHHNHHDHEDHDDQECFCYKAPPKRYGRSAEPEYETYYEPEYEPEYEPDYEPEYEPEYEPD